MVYYSRIYQAEDLGTIMLDIYYPTLTTEHVNIQFILNLVLLGH